MVVPALFVAGATVNILFTAVAVVIHRKHDGYSLMRSQLSYTGNRVGFHHHRYDRYFKRAHQPFWFNTAYQLGGLLFVIAFITIDSWALRISGSIFGLAIFFVGLYDVGTNYKRHEIALLTSQIAFLSITITLHILYFHWTLLLVSFFVFFFMFWYLYTKISNTKEYNPDLLTLPQRIFAILEVVFLGLIPIWILGVI